MDDDLKKRFDAISVAEMRQKVDLAVGYLRELRAAINVSLGMSAEGAPGPIPELDVERAKKVLDEVREMLPLLRRRLTPEERARLKPFGPEERAMAEAAFAVVDAYPEAFDEAAAEQGSELRSADVHALREHIQKTDMLAEVEAELRLSAAEMAVHGKRIVEELEALAARILARGGES